VYSGLLMWNIFSSGMSASANSMVTNANIIKKIYFPRLIIPMSSVLVSLFDFLMALLIFAGMLVYYHNEVNISISRMLIGIPCSIIITIFGTFGPGCLLAALNVKYRDFRYIIPFLIQVLLFLTPVIYPVTMLGHEWQRWLVAMNPVSGAIDLFRWTFTGSPLHLHLLAISAASGVLFFIAGLFYFRKTEAYFADLA
jgi:lipopolysaccharide transport system permease protein